MMISLSSFNTGFENVPNVSNIRRSCFKYKNSTGKRGTMIKPCANKNLLYLYDGHLLTGIALFGGCYTSSDFELQVMQQMSPLAWKYLRTIEIILS